MAGETYGFLSVGQTRRDGDTGEMISTVQIICGDALESLRGLPDQSVHCCVTSPPYWGLRDYKHTGQSGQEKTPELYVAALVVVFQEVKRVLRDDGTLWLNLGDSYAGSWGNYGGQNRGNGNQREITAGSIKNAAWDGREQERPNASRKLMGIKPKDLVGIPWLVAFALRANGWYLRSDIIWAKRNCMPESVTDRPTRSHEYIFLLSKSERYHYDAEAIAEPVLESSLVRAEAGVKFGGNNLCEDTRLQSGNKWIPKAEGSNSRMNRSHDPAHEREYNGKIRSESDQSSGRRMLKNMKEARDNGGAHNNPFGVTRNKRTVWSVATNPYKDAHFATFPPDLIKPCILAGCPVGGTVLDPFGGSGTTGQVALELGRSAILIELNPDYCELARRRTHVTPGLALT